MRGSGIAKCAPRRAIDRPAAGRAPMSPRLRACAPGPGPSRFRRLRTRSQRRRRGRESARRAARPCRCPPAPGPIQVPCSSFSARHLTSFVPETQFLSLSISEMKPGSDRDRSAPLELVGSQRLRCRAPVDRHGPRRGTDGRASQGSVPGQHHRPIHGRVLRVCDPPMRIVVARPTFRGLAGVAHESDFRDVLPPLVRASA